MNGKVLTTGRLVFKLFNFQNTIEEAIALQKVCCLFVQDYLFYGSLVDCTFVSGSTNHINSFFHFEFLKLLTVLRSWRRPHFVGQSFLHAPEGTFLN